LLAAYSNVSEQINAGTLRVLAVAAPNRVESLPNVPTVDEVGYRGFELENWFGVIAPAKTSNDIVTQFAGLVHRSDADTANQSETGRAGSSSIRNMWLRIWRSAPQTV